MEDIDRLSQGMENPAADYTVKKDQNVSSFSRDG